MSLLTTRHTTFSLLLFLSLTFLLGCGGPSSSQDDGSASSTDRPELTDEVIHERINGVRIGNIPEENGTGQPISWRFYEEEPKEVAVVDKQVEGSHATIILDIKTQSTPKARDPRALAGQIRTEWEITSGWVLRRWEVIGTENISMKYKNLPKPPASDSNNPQSR
jgi:hypothetical protein